MNARFRSGSVVAVPAMGTTTIGSEPSEGEP